MASGKVGLITGGASGMGLALARHLHSKGWKITITDRDSAKGQQVANELGENVLFVHGEVTKYEDLCNAFAATVARWDRLDFVAANAGTIESRPSLNDYSSTSEGLPPPKPNLQTMDVNLTAPLHTIWLASHYMAQNRGGGGKILVTSSSAGIYPIPFQPQYTASKHALIGVVRSLAPILREDQITINALLPGLVLTGLTEITTILPEFLTPMSTFLEACDRFLDSDETGCCAEVSKDKIYMREQHPYPDESQRRVMTKLAESVDPNFSIP